MITTLTLNPAFDVHVTIKEFELFKENFADSVIKDIGGKGINISRALNEFDVETTALIICGTENGDEFTDGLKKSGFSNFKTVECIGRIRENITIHPSVGKETRLSYRGFNCTKSHLLEIEKLIEDSEYVTFTGSLPNGISVNDAEEFSMRLKAKGIKLIIDSKSIDLDMLRRIKPYLIKPNEEEIFDYTGVSEKEKLRDVAISLNKDGIENVLISLGKDGAILACNGEVYEATVPQIKVVSTIGAGDSTIAGFLLKNGTHEEKLRTAVAFGSAACLREGTKPPLKPDIDKIIKEVTIKKSGI